MRRLATLALLGPLALCACSDDQLVTSFQVGGRVDGLEGSGLVLQNNGGDDLRVGADGPFWFKASLASGSAYAVTVKTQPGDPAQRCTVTNGSGTVSGTVDTVKVSCSTLVFPVGGTVTGLTGSGLVLRNNGRDDLPVTADGAFRFPTPVASGDSFTVTVAVQPTRPSQYCRVENGYGIVGTGDVTTVGVRCTTTPIVLGGRIAGLVGTGLVLQNNGADDLVVLPGASTYSFSAARDAPYSVTVKAQPKNPSQTCVVVNASGTTTQVDKTDVDVTCTTDRFPVGGSVSGLVGAGLVLHNASDGTDLPVPAGSTEYHFQVPANGSYAISVKSQPANPVQTCSVAKPSGTVVDAAVTDVHVTCTTASFTVGGTLNGLLGTGLVLQNNGGADLAVPPGATSFSFPAASGSAYAVSVKAQPQNPSQLCTVSNANGVVAGANVTNVVVLCATTSFTVGGSVTGLVGTGLVLQNNGGADLPLLPGAADYRFTVPSNSAYAITVKTQPSSPTQVCVVANGVGTVGAASIANVHVTCTTSTFTVGGSVSGLVGSGFVLQNNGVELPLGPGAATFSFPVASGAPYAVSVKTQPSSPTQLCTVANASGTVGAANVVNVNVTCSTATFTVGGTVTGLLGTGLVLQNSGGAEVSVAAGAAGYQFTVPSGSPYAIAVKTQPSGPAQLCTVANPSGTVSGANVGNVHVTCVTASFTVGGPITGLLGSGLVLQNNGGSDLPVSAGAGSYSFPANSGSSYSITVKTQPSNPTQSCTVANPTGSVAGANVVTVAITCTTTQFTVGGNVTGVVGAGLVLQNNGKSDLTIAPGTSHYSFTVPSGGGYHVTVKSQPSSPAQVCTVANAVGTVGAASVGNVHVTCTTSVFTVGGTITGLVGNGLVLQNNGGSDLSLSPGAGSYSFPVASNNPYSITIKAQPAGPTQVCTVANGSGTVSTANVANVHVTCTTSVFTVGGTITGLVGTGLVLQNNGGGDLSPSPGATGYTFPVTSGGGYAITVKTQPKSPQQTCVVANGSGTVTTASVTNVHVTCTTATFTVGGNVTGLVGTGLVLQNNGVGDLALSPGAGTYSFTVPSNGTYSITVKSQPTGPIQTCVVANPSGTVGTANVTNVHVTCTTATYTVGGTVTGLSGSGLVLTNNGVGDLTLLPGAASYQFTVPSGGPYAIAVKTQPTGPSQSCSVANAGGTVGSSNVTNVHVTCVTGAFSIGGSVTGLTGSGLVLQLNGGSDRPISPGASTYSFGGVPSGTAYTVTVLSQPSNPSQTCTVVNSTGTLGGANVTSVNVSCVVNSFAVGGSVSGVVGSGLVLQLNGANNKSVSAGTGSYSYPGIASGTGYTVSVLSQPTNPSQTCTVSNPTGTVGSASVINANVTCVTNTYSVGGSVGNLLGSGLVLQLNGGSDQAVAAGAASHSFLSVASGTPYTVTVKTQPTNPTQVCSVANPSGTVGAASVGNVNVTCTCSPYCPRVVVFAGSTSATAGHVAGSYVPGGTWQTTRLTGTTLLGTSVAMLGDGTAVGVVNEPAGIVGDSTVGPIKFTRWNGTWSALADVGTGVTTRNRVALKGGVDAEAIFHGQNYYHYRTTFSGTAWSTPTQVSNVFGPSAPALVRRSPTAFTVGYTQDSSNLPTAIDLEGGQWQPVVNLTTERSDIWVGPSLTTPASGPTLLMAWIRESYGGQVRFATRTGGVWTAQADVPGAFTTDPVALLPLASGEVLLAFRGTDGKLYTTTYASGTWATNPTSVQAISLAGPPALAKGQGGAVAELAYIGTDSAAYHLRLIGTTWTTPVQVGTSVHFVSIASGP